VILIGVVAFAGIALGSAQAAGPLPPLAGPSLRGATHLRLIVGDTPPVVLDVDTTTITAVGGVTGQPKTGGPQVGAVLPALGGAYVSVWDGRTYSGYFVGADGSARRAGAGADLIPSRDSPAVWTLTPATGGCMLRLVPSSGAATHAPCGSLQLDTASGLLITNPPYAMLVNGSTGKVLRRVRVPGQVKPISGTLVLENSRPSVEVPGKLTLVDLMTGFSAGEGDPEPVEQPEMRTDSRRVTAT